MSAADKLKFMGIVLSGNYTKNSKGKVINMTAAQVRLLVQSSGNFPISFVVEEFQSSFENKFPPNKPRTDNGGVALAHELKTYTDHLIEFPAEPIKRPGTVTGTAKFKIRYGHKGREKYNMDRNVHFEAGFDETAGGHVVLQQQDIA
ncbi:MAG: hypothetical protein ACR2K5_07730 [Pseudolabrys sp.]